MTEPIKSNYRDVEIIYLEDPNKWRFTVNGRERSTESLAKARESIDRALDDVKKGKAWEPFEAYFCRGYSSNNFRKVKVTSMAETRYGKPDFWINDNGQRSKESASSLYKVSAKNDALIAELQRLQKESEALAARESEARHKLTNIEIPKG